MAYWSTADDHDPTYHTCSNCPAGKQILPLNLRSGQAPSYRVKCRICREYERDGVCK